MLKHKLFAVISLVTLGTLSMSGVAAAAQSASGKKNSAATSNTTSIQSVAQSYGTRRPLEAGLIVQLDPKNANAVIPATYANSKKIFGVVVMPSDAPVTLSSSSSGGNQAYVATSGRYRVLVSNENGTISPGDYISISDLSGIGMKANTAEAGMLGVAAGSFDGKHNVASTVTLKASRGKQVKVALGSIPVTLAVGNNPQASTGDNGVPNFAQKISTTLVGKPISPLRFYISVGLLAAALAIVASLLFGGVKSGMTAIGRNPLARKSITRNLFQVIAVSLIIFIGSLFAVYLILKT